MGGNIEKLLEHCEARGLPKPTYSSSMCAWWIKERHYCCVQDSEKAFPEPYVIRRGTLGDEQEEFFLAYLEYVGTLINEWYGWIV